MNLKKSLQNRIRGWFPSTPTMPHQDKTPVFQNTKALANPLPPLFENKFQRNVGILIGFGIGLLVIGFAGASITNQTYSEVQRFLSYEGAGTDNYLFRYLLDQTAFYLAMAVGGIFTAVLGAISLRSQTFRKASVNKEKHFLGNFLFGFGSGLIIISFRFLFLFFLAPNDPILNHDYIQLKFFTGFFVIGACLFVAGIMSWRLKK